MTAKISDIAAAASAAATDLYEIETAGGVSKRVTAAQLLTYIEGAIGTAAFRALINDADAATLQATLGLVIGTNVQAYDADLLAIAGLTSAADKGIQFTGAGTAATYDLTAAGKALLDDANAAAQLTTLGAAPLASPTFTGVPAAPTAAADTNTTQIATTAHVQGQKGTANPLAPGTAAAGTSAKWTPIDHVHPIIGSPAQIGVAVSDETTAITTGTAKLTFRMPFAMTLTSVRASLKTASSSGAPAINVKESGTTIFSTTVTIDANEKTSTTAATPAVISDSALADDAEMTVDIDTAGTGAVGLKLWLIGTRA
jgi:hypothetical protein